jgi:hypothetical protein
MELLKKRSMTRARTRRNTTSTRDSTESTGKGPEPATVGSFFTISLWRFLLIVFEMPRSNRALALHATGVSTRCQLRDVFGDSHCDVPGYNRL